ncbi:hypothetical protein [Ruegeria lacuscaerulensis]|uniref:hypothetical protein n=1 Tax=Ruegeria lacuscaerulensis TaxID=55218 RepID=UPI001BE4BF4D|nr:hypothetical protein [Ruegeria lacuscaerulensis]
MLTFGKWPKGKLMDWHSLTPDCQIKPQVNSDLRRVPHNANRIVGSTGGDWWKACGTSDLESSFIT